MSRLEVIFRLTALPIAVFLATIAMWWVWKTYPHDEDFLLSWVLPIYSLYLTLAAVSMGTVSGQIKQFLLLTTGISFLFVAELFLRVVGGFILF